MKSVQEKRFCPLVLTIPHIFFTLQVLNEELDCERERRWKAEQAAGRLVEHVRKLQSQLSESQRQREECVVREAKLEQELREKVEILGTVQKQVKKEKKHMQRFTVFVIFYCRITGMGPLKFVEDKLFEFYVTLPPPPLPPHIQIEELQNVAERKQAEVENLKTTESKHLEMLHKLEESCRALECERLRERTELCSRLHDSEVSSIMKYWYI